MLLEIVTFCEYLLGRCGGCANLLLSRKSDLLKEYDPERCMCKEPPEGEMACGEGCINRYE
jgi:hypothetical protein